MERNIRLSGEGKAEVDKYQQQGSTYQDQVATEVGDLEDDLLVILELCVTPDESDLVRRGYG